MTSPTPILTYYAAWHIDDLFRTNKALKPLAQLVQQRFGDVDTTKPPIDAQEAEQYILIPTSGEEYPGDVFEAQTLGDCYDIACKVLDLACDPRISNARLVQVAQYLQPLYSQDASTVMVGWDMVEYMDWYFGDAVSRPEREKYARELLDDWQYLRNAITARSRSHS